MTVEFYTPNGLERPVRLCDKTRRFAYESLNHRYGRDTREQPGVTLDGIPDFQKLSPLEKYDAAIRKIAQECRVRVCDGELISGAATLGMAIGHEVPATFGGKSVFGSVSHLTTDFETVLRRGINGIRDDVARSLAAPHSDGERAFLKSCDNTLDSFALWHTRYLEALTNRPEYADNYKNLLRVPFEPARNFYEAVQSLWFTFAFVRLCGNWPGIGRIDEMLGGYLEKDLADGVLTLDRAREILAHFFIKGCEWVSGGDYGSGDAQHYQNLVLAGVDENGSEVTNAVTYLVLDILEELGISDFPTTVRLNRNSDERLLRRVAEVMRFGGGMLAVYNEELIIEAMTGYGYELKEARRFANDGCWEVQVPGKTFFTYSPFDALGILQHKTLKRGGFSSFEELYAQYVQDLNEKTEEIFRKKSANCPDGKWVSKTPCTVVSVFERGCIEKGRSYFEGGPVYNVCSPHIGGFPDALNSLYAIKKLVFDDKKVGFEELMRILENDWEGCEPLRRYALTHYRYYGNDNDEVDLLGRRLLHDFALACARLDGRCGYAFPPGVSTFGRQLAWAQNREASAHGHRKNEVLAPNCSPTPGSDSEGVTAVIRSYCKADLKEMVTGAALDIKLLPSSVSGEEGIDALVALMRGFVTLGGFFMQPDVVDADILKRAQERPEEYGTLSVRVSGWNARFVTLNKEWQDMLIQENEK